MTTIRLSQLLRIGLLGATVAIGPVFAQTQLDLRTQAKQVDFSAAARTKPFKTGATLPTTCGLGEAFFKTDATAGQNLYGCTAANVWTLQTGTILTNIGSPTAPNYSATFSGLTIVAIPGSVHRLSTTGLLVSCYDTSTPARIVEPDSVLINSTTYDVTINFAVPQSGTCVVNGSSPGSATTTSGDTATATATGAASTTLDVVRASGTTLTIGGQCSVAAPCNVRFGNTVYGITAGAAATLTGSATGTALIYALRDGSLVVGHNLSVACAGCRAQANTTAFPPDALPLYTWTASNGAWDLNGGLDRRAFLSQKVIAAGPGVLMSDNGIITTLGLDTALVPSYLTAVASIDFPAIATASCANDVTLTMPGASPGDAVAAGWPASFPAGLTGVMWVSAADTVSVRLCNTSGASLDPAPATYRATVVRSF